MAAEENRLAHFRRLVESQSPRGKDGKPVLREGYRAVADATGLKYDYVYQVYQAKSGKKGLGPAALRKISEAYGEGRPPGWMDLPPEEPAELEPEFEPLRPPNLQEAWMALADVFLSLDDLGREFALPLLASLAKNPERADVALKTLETLVQVHSKGPPQDPLPTNSRKKPATFAPASRDRGKATLVLKIGGGHKQQFDLPLTRSAFRAESASPNERAWYERLKAAPKTSRS